jgi:hypothetical protein
MAEGENVSPKIDNPVRPPKLGIEARAKRGRCGCLVGAVNEGEVARLSLEIAAGDNLVTTGAEIGGDIKRQPRLA